MTDQTLPARILETLYQANRTEVVERFSEDAASAVDLLNRISGMASFIFDAPVAQITVLDREEQLMLVSRGFAIVRSATQTSFCAHTISHPEELTVVLDTLADDRFRENPFVVNEPHIRFYAGAPVIFNGIAVGTLCVYDFQPRRAISEEQRHFLEDVSARLPLILFENAPILEDGDMLSNINWPMGTFE